MLITRKRYNDDIGELQSRLRLYILQVDRLHQRITKLEEQLAPLPEASATATYMTGTPAHMWGNWVDLDSKPVTETLYSGLGGTGPKRRKRRANSKRTSRSK